MYFPQVLTTQYSSNATPPVPVPERRTVKCRHKRSIGLNCTDYGYNTNE
jgi:hypothetical protein